MLDYASYTATMHGRDVLCIWFSSCWHLCAFTAHCINTVRLLAMNSVVA